MNMKVKRNKKVNPDKVRAYHLDTIEDIEFDEAYPDSKFILDKHKAFFTNETDISLDDIVCNTVAVLDDCPYPIYRFKDIDDRGIIIVQDKNDKLCPCIIFDGTSRRIGIQAKKVNGEIGYSDYACIPISEQQLRPFLSGSENW